ncbi:MAG: lipoprotein intramolecular transacylase Lit [Chloroflexota bacterium]
MLPDSRAPAAVGLLFGIALAVAVMLTGPLLLFNPWFTSALQARHEVAAEFSTSRAEIDRVTGEILVDLYANGPFDAALTQGEPLLDERERSHMGDVSRLVQLLAGITVVALVVAAVTGAWLRHERQRQGRIMLIAAGIVGVAAVLLAGIFAAAFEPAFLAFHAVFFPPGTYLFSEGSNLIVLFPQGFWLDASIIAGVAIVVTALIVTPIGFARWRAGSRPSAES